MSPSRPASPKWTLSWVHMALALAVGAGLPLLWVGLAPADRPSTAPAHAGGGLAASPVVAVQATGVVAMSAPPVPEMGVVRVSTTPAATPQIARVRDPNGDLTPDITDFINAGEVPTMAEVISRLHAAGVHGGLGAFNPPGTRPPLVGVAVSDDFELPPGYVRHHQFTDDGQRIEPILMFSPDHPLVVAAQAAGQAELRPQDRVVPAALVPPGLPVRHIVVPAPGQAATPGKSPP